MSSKWKEISLDQALDINPSVKMQKGDAYPFVDMQTIEAGNKFVSPMQTREFKGSGSRFVDGDTLMARITPCLENGKISRYRSMDKTPAHGSTEFIVLRHRDKVTAPEFVYYLTISDQVKPFAIAQMTGSSGRQRVPVDAFKRLTVTLPRLKEQQAIAEILRTLDDKIELNRQMCETLEKTAAALFRSWFVDFDPVRAKMEGRTPEGMSADLLSLFPDRFEDSELGAIPSGWKISEIGKLVDAVGGSTPSTKNPVFWDGKHFWATPKDLSALTHRVLLNTERKITDKGLNEISSGLLPEGTVLLSSRAPIGYVAVAEVPVAINQGLIAMKPSKKLGTQFALHWTIENLEKIKSHANGSTFQEISKGAFRPLKVCCPPHKLLESFEQIASSLHVRCVELVRQNNTLTKTRDALLPKLISGELRVEDVEG